MSFSLKAKDGGEGYDGPKIDWKAIAKQVEDDTHDARISLIVDLGVQERGKGVSHGSKDDFTIADTEKEANDLLDEAEEIMGNFLFEKEKLDEYEDTDDGKFKVDFSIYDKKDAQEVAIFADLIDTRVEYVEGQGENQYRVMLNRSFKNDITGMALTKAKPIKDGGLWTFASNGLLYKLAIATGHAEIVQDEEFNTDIGRMLGEPLGIPTTKKNDFIRVGAPSAIPKKYLDDVGMLDNEAVGITFDDATVELLEAAQLRYGIILKIKAATNYEGSAMQAAIEELEAKQKAAKKSGSDENAAETKDEDKSSRRKRKAAPEAAEEKEEKTSRRKSKPEDAPVVEGDDGEFEDDVPFNSLHSS